MNSRRFHYSFVTLALFLTLSGCLVVVVPPIQQADELDQASIDRIRGTVREARERARESDFLTAYRLLDLSGAHIELLLDQVPQQSGLVQLKDWYVEEYREVSRECKLYAEAISGLSGVSPPTCSEPPHRN